MLDIFDKEDTLKAKLMLGAVGYSSLYTAIRKYEPQQKFDLIGEFIAGKLAKGTTPEKVAGKLARLFESQEKTVPKQGKVPLEVSSDYVEFLLLVLQQMVAYSWPRIENKNVLIHIDGRLVEEYGDLFVKTLLFTKTEPGFYIVFTREPFFFNYFKSSPTALPLYIKGIHHIEDRDYKLKLINMLPNNDTEALKLYVKDFKTFNMLLHTSYLNNLLTEPETSDRAAAMLFTSDDKKYLSSLNFYRLCVIQDLVKPLNLDYVDGKNVNFSLFFKWGGLNNSTKFAPIFKFLQQTVNNKNFESFYSNYCSDPSALSVYKLMLVHFYALMTCDMLLALQVFNKLLQMNYSSFLYHTDNQRKVFKYLVLNTWLVADNAYYYTYRAKDLYQEITGVAPLWTDEQYKTFAKELSSNTYKFLLSKLGSTSIEPDVRKELSSVFCNYEKDLINTYVGV